MAKQTRAATRVGPEYRSEEMPVSEHVEAAAAHPRRGPAAARRGRGAAPVLPAGAAGAVAVGGGLKISAPHMIVVGGRLRLLERRTTTARLSLRRAADDLAVTTTSARSSRPLR